jgi:hypothetical protein
MQQTRKSKTYPQHVYGPQRMLVLYDVNVHRHVMSTPGNNTVPILPDINSLYNAK